jgi:hypothetical protein
MGQICEITTAGHNADEFYHGVLLKVLVQQQIVAFDQHAGTRPDIVTSGADLGKLAK